MARPAKPKTSKHPSVPPPPHRPAPRPSMPPPPPPPPAGPPAATPSPRSVVWVAAAVTVAGLAAVAMLRGRDPAPPRGDDGGDAPARVLDARLEEGPAWPGELDVRGIELTIPEGYVQASECGTSPEPWRFVGMTRDQVTALAREAHLPDAVATPLAAGLSCDAAGCAYTPTLEQLTALPAASRDVLYRALRGMPGNRLQVFAYLRPRALGPWGDLPGLTPRVRELLGQGAWRLDDDFAFSDQFWLCAQLATDAERVEAIRALRTRYGLDVSVRVPAHGDLTPLVRYWSVGHDPAAVSAVLLEARAQGTVAPVAALLPPMARARLNRFPERTALAYDCFWTAARFFEGTTPSDHFPGPEGIVSLVRAEYVPVPSAEARLGDLVAFIEPDGSFAHTATQIAGDVLFTKNGRSHERPWVLMHLDTIRAMYPLVREVRWYRRRAAR